MSIRVGINVSGESAAWCCGRVWVAMIWRPPWWPAALLVALVAIAMAVLALMTR